MGGVLSGVLCYVNILPLTMFPMFAIILLRTTEEQYFGVSSDATDFRGRQSRHSHQNELTVHRGCFYEFGMSYNPDWTHFVSIETMED